ncbi:MAG: ABC transporter permease [Erysipelotrichaceae bacterium]|nr:ABC transporter permease [Erysipelotrichaceae bacterium]MDY5251799.1 ABC transporter permease [Erysipelotrichaceae bacterium]
MKKYILSRIIKSIIALFVVLSIVIVMLFTLIPRENIFKNDTSIQRMKGDEKTSYMYSKWDELGYLDYLTFNEMCRISSDDVNACIAGDTEESTKILQEYENKGYVIKQFNNGSHYGYYEYSPFEVLANFYSGFISIDNPNKIVDSDNPDLERKYYVDSDQNGVPAIMCSGCEYKYQVYFDGNFPFIHQNIIKLDFGTSYPTKVGIPTMNVIADGQGNAKLVEQTFPTGSTQSSPLDQHSCRYKPTSTLDRLDTTKFTDNYANCNSLYDSPSMISTSLLFGLVSLFIAYLIAIPAGIYMARKKGKFADKLGIVYINFLIAVPSLAFIFFVKQIGQSFGLPDKFPHFGFGDIRSYILPILILALLNTSSLMMWTRRYMIDQSNADYVKFARAKGLSEKEIFNRHILKNAIIPIVNQIPVSIVMCISGSVITETVFAIPGMGKMLPDSINMLNNNMVITLTFIFTGLSVFAVLVGDLLMTAIDPRIKLTEKGE